MQDTSALFRRIEDLASEHRELRHSLTRAPGLLAELDAILDGMPDEMDDTAAIEARVDTIESALSYYAAESEEGESGHAMQAAIYHANVL